MIRTAEDICALCKHFRMKDYPKHAAVGVGRCFGYDGTNAPLIKPFLPWTTPACGRYQKASNLAVRREWVAQQCAEREQNVPPTAAPT